MARKGKSGATKQTSITATALPLLKKPCEHFGKQVAIPGSFWQGRMSEDERKTKYLCTIRDFELIHKWDDGRPPTNAIQLQEMGEGGEGSLEHGDASGEIFWVPYPTPFLKFFYDTFPDMMPMPKGTDDAAVQIVEGVKKEDANAPKHDVHPDFPHVRLGTSEVYRCFAINSDTLVESGPRSGMFKASFECVITCQDGSACGSLVHIYHRRDRACSTTNLISHVKHSSDRAHQEAAKKITENSSNTIILEDGAVVQKHNFAENFPHLVDLLWLRAAGLTQALMEKDEFRDYVRRYDARASFPDNRTMHRIAQAVHALQRAQLISRISALKLQFKGRPCIGLQLDMWTDSNTHTSYAVSAAQSSH